MKHVVNYNSNFKNGPTEMDQPQESNVGEKLPTKLRVNVHALSLRVNPNKEALLVNKTVILKEGTVIKFVDKVDEEWYKVDTEYGEGYVMSKYLLEV